MLHKHRAVFLVSNSAERADVTRSLQAHAHRHRALFLVSNPAERADVTRSLQTHAHTHRALFPVSNSAERADVTRSLQTHAHKHIKHHVLCKYGIANHASEALHVLRVRQIM